MNRVHSKHTKPFGWQISVLPLLLALFLVACLSSTTGNETTAIETVNTTTLEPGDGQFTVEATREPTVEATMVPATPMPTIEAVLPAEIARSFDREQCPDHCWHNVMLGQNLDEVLEAIRNDPTTDKVFDFQNGDVLQIEELEDGETSIDWFIQRIPSERQRMHGSVSLDNKIVTFLIVPVEPPFPLQAVLDKLGEPELLVFMDGGLGFGVLSLMYPKDRVWFTVRAIGDPIALTGESMVEGIAYSGVEFAQEAYCVIGYLRWGGLGSIAKYFPPNDDELRVDSVPEWCPPTAP